MAWAINSLPVPISHFNKNGRIGGRHFAHQLQYLKERGAAADHTFEILGCHTLAISRGLFRANEVHSFDAVFGENILSRHDFRTSVPSEFLRLLVHLRCGAIAPDTYKTGQPLPTFTVSRVCNECSVPYNRQWSGNGVP